MQAVYRSSSPTGAEATRQLVKVVRVSEGQEGSWSFLACLRGVPYSLFRPARYGHGSGMLEQCSASSAGRSTGQPGGDPRKNGYRPVALYNVVGWTCHALPYPALPGSGICCTSTQAESTEQTSLCRIPAFPSLFPLCPRLGPLGARTVEPAAMAGRKDDEPRLALRAGCLLEGGGGSRVRLAVRKASHPFQDARDSSTDR